MQVPQHELLCWLHNGNIRRQDMAIVQTGQQVSRTLVHQQMAGGWNQVFLFLSCLAWCFLSLPWQGKNEGRSRL